ncbi:ABC transporter permease [Pseudonocardia nigra]|uniref:ABC transporter permease n=1 Tax=Pseudonocardia nigra TaxID=1921578 RepID=UPI001C5F9B98|nr:ABC transporter permease [Pseudonocardia nigra]
MSTTTSGSASGTGSPIDPATDPVAAGGASPSRRKLVIRRFFRHKLGVTGLVVFVGLFALAYLGPLISPWTVTNQDFTSLLEPPTPDHWFGTTQIGEDVFVRTMDGLRKSLVIGLLVGLISTAIATIVGATAAYFGGWVDRALMWVVDLMLVLPALLVIAILSPAFEGSTWLILVVLLAAFSWMIAARLVRGMTLSLREREFVQAAKFAGVPAWKIILKHIIPNMASLLIIDATVNIGQAVLAETSLSYLGFGVQPPDVSLGTLISEGSRSALTFPWLFLFAGGLLVITVLAVNLIGDGLRDALDPQSTRSDAR